MTWVAFAALGVFVAIWSIVNCVRSRQVHALQRRRQDTQEALSAFAQAAMSQDTVEEIVDSACEVAAKHFGAHRFVLIQEDETGWVASQPVGPPPPPVPANLRGLFAWFRHNAPIASEADLRKARFGAMRTPMQQLMQTYAIDVVMPLVHQGELIAILGMALDRKATMLDRELLRIFRLEVTASCANVRLHHEASHLVSLAEEIDMANSIELAMVPTVLEGRAGNFDWAGHFAARNKAASDFWGIYPLAKNRLMIVMGDAVGGDLDGTMVSAVVKSCCDQIFARRPDELDPSQLLEMLNNSLFRPHRPALASCVAALFDPTRSLIFYANAGHIAPMRLTPQAEGIDVGVLRGSGPLLGDLVNPDFKLRSVPLTKRDSFMFITDGMVARRNDRGEDFGYRKLFKLLASLSSGHPEDLRGELLRGIRSYGADERLRDDQALLILRCH